MSDQPEDLREDTTCPLGFVPPGPDMRRVIELTPAEQAHLQGIQDWLDRSAKSTMILSGYIVCGKCGQQNNPNNLCCHSCGGRLG